MKKILAFIISALLLVSCLSLSSCKDGAAGDKDRDEEQTENNGQKDDTEKPDAKQYAGVVIINDLTKEEFANERIDKTDDIITALDAVLYVCEKNNVDIIHDGSFVSEINGIKGDETNNTYWMYYINDEEPNLGLSDYVLENNDVVIISYEKVNDIQ